MQEIDFRTLPKDVLGKIPISLRKFKDVHVFEELPYNIQHLIEEYLENKKSVSYNVVYDCKPEISKYGDFEVISDKHKLVLEYFKNYMLSSVGGYPFDPVFGCRLKHYLQKLDTELSGRLIQEEIAMITRTISSDLNINISATYVSTKTSNTNLSTTYNCYIKVKIENIDYNIQLTV